jgi:hypothetical protein
MSTSYLSPSEFRAVREARAGAFDACCGSVLCTNRKIPSSLLEVSIALDGNFGKEYFSQEQEPVSACEYHPPFDNGGFRYGILSWAQKASSNRNLRSSQNRAVMTVLAWWSNRKTLPSHGNTPPLSSKMPRSALRRNVDPHNTISRRHVANKWHTAPKLTKLRRGTPGFIPEEDAVSPFDFSFHSDFSRRSVVAFIPISLSAPPIPPN